MHQEKVETKDNFVDFLKSKIEADQISELQKSLVMKDVEMEEKAEMHITSSASRPLPYYA